MRTISDKAKMNGRETSVIQTAAGTPPAKEHDNESELILAGEAIRITGFAPEYFYKLVRSGEIRRYQPTDNVRGRYYRSELLAMLRPKPTTPTVVHVLSGNPGQHTGRRP